FPSGFLAVWGRLCARRSRRRRDVRPVASLFGKRSGSQTSSGPLLQPAFAEASHTTSATPFMRRKNERIISLPLIIPCRNRPQEDRFCPTYETIRYVIFRRTKAQNRIIRFL